MSIRIFYMILDLVHIGEMVDPTEGFTLSFFEWCCIGMIEAGIPIVFSLIIC